MNNQNNTEKETICLMPHQETTSDLRFGEWLVKNKFLKPNELEKALALHKEWGVSIGQVLIAKGYLSSFKMAETLAQKMDQPFANLVEFPPQKDVLDENDIEFYCKELILPWKRDKDGILWVTTSNPSKETYEKILATYKNDTIKIAITSKFDILWSVNHIFEKHHTDHSIKHLQNHSPHHSASTNITRNQKKFFFSLLFLFGISLFFNPFDTLLGLSIFINLFYFSSFVFRFFIALRGLSLYENKFKNRSLKNAMKKLKDYDLPIYSILVPLYKEGNIVEGLAQALRNIDYPMAKLDIKLIFEEDDTETIQAARDLKLESNFEFIIVPPSMPRSKPKALNYAFRFARGEYVVVYDAEDQPEPDQLRKALATFNMSDKRTICIQARLNYFNSHENWLSRLFTIEYSLWYDYMLPGLETLGIPIPLGGTSNHFKVNALHELHAWDPFNMTEDADLGIRISSLKFKVKILDSTTYEEANFRATEWIHQRSRWIKGYMQTWLVHMRSPIDLYRSLGFKGFLGFQLFIGGSIFIGIVNPLLWVLFSIWIFVDIPSLPLFFPGIILTISFLNLMIGNGLAIYLGFIGPSQRKLSSLSLYTFIIPIYWLMISIAAYKGLWELLFKTHFWHKTAHGVSKFAPVAKSHKSSS